jgi:hypothetical protein
MTSVSVLPFHHHQGGAITMAEGLPDEIIAQFLQLHFTVPDDLFSDTSDTSPFASRSEFSSTVALLVSKAWLCCGLPLLYRTVILRSQGQAKALWATLRKQKRLGKTIKKLRVEGGFNHWMFPILKSAPNIEDLCLFLDIVSWDNVSGLEQGLASVNPTRLIICDRRWGFENNQVANQLIDAITTARKKWSNLVHPGSILIHCPYEVEGRRQSYFPTSILRMPCERLS